MEGSFPDKRGECSISLTGGVMQIDGSEALDSRPLSQFSFPVCFNLLVNDLEESRLFEKAFSPNNGGEGFFFDPRAYFVDTLSAEFVFANNSLRLLDKLKERFRFFASPAMRSSSLRIANRRSSSEIDSPRSGSESLRSLLEQRKLCEPQ